ncbi:hypothetical protein [Hymenobacter negativus]|uniref:STAS/SEC14 domain-containing protein n=1 Tax=Hymenobacter negativus TaxID=2795026 RepID=A0ABS3QGE6_9BACT|nr:hypothetical protein [Hymenobacter negativus]MBO2010237.1 hypothetical protein [Hymenobacter negativus]
MSLANPLLLFKNNAGQLLADPTGFLRTNWGSQARTLAETRDLFINMQRELQRHRWSRILINQVGMAPFSQAEQQWVAHEWLPQAVQAGGYRHGAVLVSHDVLVRLATAYVTTHVQGLPLVYRSFDKDADAVRWLVQQPKSPIG